MRKDLEKLVALIRKTGDLHGRKKLQKMVFLLQKAGVDFGKTFRYHYYGPYSTELQLEMDALVDMGVLAESYNGYSYAYRIADASGLDTGWDPCERNAPLIAYLNGQPPQVLEVAATVSYLSEKGYGDLEAVKRKAVSLKPDLENKMEEAEAVYHRVMGAGRAKQREGGA